MQRETSWPGLVTQARRQQVLPLVFHNLEQLEFIGVPPAIREALKHAYRANTIRNFAFARELAAVLAALDSAGVPVVPLKGLPLAESLYGSLVLRMCWDIDLLVPRALRPVALNVLSARGYRPIIQRPFLQKLALRHDIEFGLVRQDESLEYPVELHWGLFTSTPTENAAMRELWHAAIRTHFLGAACYSLTPEWEFLFLAAHAARHQWQGLKWLVDIHAICTRGALDWMEVKTLADRLQWTELVQITLSIAHVIFETTVPAVFPHTRLPHWLQIFPLRRRSPGLGAVLFQVRLLKQPSHKLRFLSRACLVPTVAEEDWWPLSNRLSFLYYLLRPTRLLLKWGGFLDVGRLDRGPGHESAP
jgi:hypothetical protein